MAKEKYFIVKERYREACSEAKDRAAGNPKAPHIWTLQVQADYLECSLRMMAKYVAETNQNPIPFPKAKMLADFLKCDALWLVGKRDSPIETAEYIENLRYAFSHDNLEEVLKLIGVEVSDNENGYTVTIDTRNRIEKNDNAPDTSEKYNLTGVEAYRLRDFLLKSLVSETRKYCEFCETHARDLMPGDIT